MHFKRADIFLLAGLACLGCSVPHDIITVHMLVLACKVAVPSTRP